MKYTFIPIRPSRHREYFVDQTFLQKNQKAAATSVVFLDENNNEELPRLIDFMRMRGNCDIPELVLRLAEVRFRFSINDKYIEPWCRWKNLSFPVFYRCFFFKLPI